jgi:hypothetical protein
MVQQLSDRHWPARQLFCDCFVAQHVHLQDVHVQSPVTQQPQQSQAVLHEHAWLCGVTAKPATEARVKAEAKRYLNMVLSPKKVCAKK